MAHKPKIDAVSEIKMHHARSSYAGKKIGAPVKNDVCFICGYKSKKVKNGICDECEKEFPAKPKDDVNPFLKIIAHDKNPNKI